MQEDWWSIGSHMGMLIAVVMHRICEVLSGFGFVFQRVKCDIVS